MNAFVSSTPLSVAAKPTLANANINKKNASPCMVAGKTIGETIATNPNFSTLNKLLHATSIDIDAAGGGTVFAPTNKAFAGVRPGYLEEISASPASATALLLRHLLPTEKLSVADLKKLGCGFWYTVPGGPLSYEAAGLPTIKISGASMEENLHEDVCDNGVIHVMKDVIMDLPRTIYEPLSIDQQAKVAPVESTAVIPMSPTINPVKARGASSQVSTVGGRKAMGLMSQLPFWMYGPPFNACKQEEYEPISIAVPSYGTGVDYQLMPPGSVVVIPDEVSASKLNPISGMSKYIGKTKRLVEGDGLSDYSKLDDL